MSRRAGRTRPRKRSGQASASLQSVRKQIDQLDRQLVRMLNQRARLALRTRRLKQQQGRANVDRRRETQILGRVARMSRGPLSKGSVQAIYRDIIRANHRLAHRRK